MIDARNFTYMFYGFAAAFVILVIYVVSLALRERKLTQRNRPRPPHGGTGEVVTRPRRLTAYRTPASRRIRHSEC